MPFFTKRVQDKEALVAAWFNPITQNWETPRPWDPQFKMLNPEIKQVPRGMIVGAGE